MKKKTKDAASKIAKEINIFDFSKSTNIIDDILKTTKLQNSPLMSVKVGNIQYEIWSSSKKDDKFDVISLSYSKNASAKDTHSRMTKGEILNDIVLKAFE
jgi:hypothetical protein